VDVANSWATLNGDPHPEAAWWAPTNADMAAPAVGLTHGNSETKVYLIELEGHFKGHGGASPSGSASRGSVLAFTVDQRGDRLVKRWGISDTLVHLSGLQPF